MRKSTLVSLLLGFVAATLVAATTEQIWQNIYNKSSNAIQVTVVGGSGTPVAVGTAYTTVQDEATPLTQQSTLNFIGSAVSCVNNGGSSSTDCTITGGGNTPTPLAFGTPGVLAAFAATELGAYPGSACTPPALALSTSAAGVWTCATPVPAVSGGASPVTITLANASSTGTTTNKLAKINTDGTAVILGTSDTTGGIGPVVSGAGTTGSAVIQVIGLASCVFDGGTTAGDFVTGSGTTAGDCHDAGSAFPDLTAVLGIVTTTNGGAGTYNVVFQTPDIMNATNIKGGNPGKGNTVDLTYAGKLNVTSITAISASATPAAHDRYIRCTAGSSSDQTYTLPEATGSGRVLEIKKIDSGTKACIVARATNDLIDGATSVTLSAQYQAVVVFDAATDVWDIL